MKLPNKAMKLTSPYSSHLRRPSRIQNALPTGGSQLIANAFGGRTLRQEEPGDTRRADHAGERGCRQVLTRRTSRSLSCEVRRDDPALHCASASAAAQRSKKVAGSRDAASMRAWSSPSDLAGAVGPTAGSSPCSSTTPSTK